MVDQAPALLLKAIVHLLAKQVAREELQAIVDCEQVTTVKVSDGVAATNSSKPRGRKGLPNE